MTIQTKIKNNSMFLQFIKELKMSVTNDTQ